MYKDSRALFQDRASFNVDIKQVDLLVILGDSTFIVNPD